MLMSIVNPVTFSIIVLRFVLVRNVSRSLAAKILFEWPFFAHPNDKHVIELVNSIRTILLMGQFQGYEV